MNKTRRFYRCLCHGIAGRLFTGLERHAVAAGVLFMAAGILFGRFGGRWMPVSAAVVVLWVLWLTAWVLKKRTPLGAWITIMGFLFMAGAVSTRHRLTPAPDDMMRFVSYFYGERIVLRGRVVSFPVVSRRLNKTRFLFQVERIQKDCHILKVRGTVSVQIFRPVSVRRGDQLLLIGKIHTFHRIPSRAKRGRWDYAAWMRRRGVHFVVSVRKKDPVAVVETQAVSIGERLSASVRKRTRTPVLSERSQALLDAMMWGRRTALPVDIRDRFRRTGTAHLLAISGFHVGCLCLLVLLLLRLFHWPMRVQFLWVMVTLVGYGVLVGWRPSVARVVIMTCCALTARWLGREPLSQNVWAVAAGLILAVDPLQLFEPGFQLSFSCVAAMIGLTPALRRLMGPAGGGVPTILGTTAAACLAAWLGALGWTWYHFEVLYPYSVPVNVVACVWAMAIVVMGWLLWLGGPAMGLSWCVAAVEDKVIEGFLSFLDLCMMLPGIEIPMPPLGTAGVVCYYIVLGVSGWILARTAPSGREGRG